MIKLKYFYSKNAVIINPRYIMQIKDYADGKWCGASILMLGGEELRVEEKPEQVIEMIDRAKLNTQKLFIHSDGKIELLNKNKDGEQE